MGIISKTVLFLAIWMNIVVAQIDRGMRIAEAERKSFSRIALIIGNAKYGQEPLRNPVNDARLMADVLGRLGFSKVLKGENLNLINFKSMIREFINLIKPGDIAFFYFSGHGLQYQSTNYLLPIDHDIQAGWDIDGQAIQVGWILAGMAEATEALKIVVLDACRDNPFCVEYKSINSRGLADMRAPKGSLIGYATAPGQIASDGEGDNGLFTSEFVKALQLPGLKLEDVFKRTGAAVSKQSQDRQRPWYHTDFYEDFYFLLPKSPTFFGPSVPETKQSGEVSRHESLKAKSDKLILIGTVQDKPSHQKIRSNFQELLDTCKIGKARSDKPETLFDLRSKEELELTDNSILVTIQKVIDISQRYRDRIQLGTAIFDDNSFSIELSSRNREDIESYFSDLRLHYRSAELFFSPAIITDYRALITGECPSSSSKFSRDQFSRTPLDSAGIRKFCSNNDLKLIEFSSSKARLLGDKKIRPYFIKVRGSSEISLIFLKTLMTQYRITNINKIILMSGSSSVTWVIRLEIVSL